MDAKADSDDIKGLAKLEHTGLHEKTGSIVTDVYAYDLEHMNSKRVSRGANGVVTYATERTLRLVLMVAFR